MKKQCPYIHECENTDEGSRCNGDPRWLEYYYKYCLSYIEKQKKERKINESIIKRNLELVAQ